MFAGLILTGVVYAMAVSARPKAQTGQQPPASFPAANQARGLKIVQHGGYPELQVDGKPFFPNSAAFFYSRIPRYLWESSLDLYRALGINTIDLYIIWNWHEPREGELDFDGHTNPRRDLRGLLNLIARKGFKLIARPGPTVLNEWRNGGYPDWLLAQAPYGMSLADRLEGRYPPAAERNARDAESAARMWMENPVHMAQARLWLEAVAHELVPYGASELLHVSTDEPRKQKDAKSTAQPSGPLLFVQIEDDLAIGRANSPGKEFWSYVQTLCGILRQGGVDAPCFINPTAPRAAAAGSALPTPIFTMGQWYLPPDGNSGLDERRISPSDLNALQMEAALLGTQPGFPPALIEYDAGWYAPGDDVRPQPGPASNTLLSAGLLLGAGIRGLNWFPLQDSLTPAGLETPWTNRNYRWDAALSLTGVRRGRYPAAARIGEQLRAWGSSLAASHRRTDFAVVDPLPALPPEMLTHDDVVNINASTERLLRLADYAGLAADLVDAQHQTPEQLLHYPLLLFPVFQSNERPNTVSEPAQQALAAYVRAGGTLICFPGLPVGGVLRELQQTGRAPLGHLPEGSTAWKDGAGRFVVVSKDFSSWVSLKDDFSSGRSRFEAPYAVSLLGNLLAYAGVRPIVSRPGEAPPSADFLASELVSNDGTLPLGQRSGGQGWLSVSNLSYEAPLSEVLEVISPRSSAQARQEDGGQFLNVAVNLPPAESLLLPLEVPLCMEVAPGHHCEDRVISSGAELVRAERDGKSMLLTFCAPARASVRLHLAEKPGHAELDGNPISAKWTAEDKVLESDLLRGASPGFLRVLRIPLAHTPFLPERPSDENRRPSSTAFHITALGAVRLPLGADSSLLSDPPLFVLAKGEDASLRFGAENSGDGGGEAQIRINGAFDAFAHTYVHEGMLGVLNLPVRSSAIEAALAKPPGDDGLYRGTSQSGPVGSGETSPLYFAIIPEKRAIGYTFDFDSDGQAERVLENTVLRAIFSPAAGGRLIALVDKTPDVNLASTMGMFEDSFAFTPNPAGVRPERARGRYGTFNRLYSAEWIAGAAGPALHMAYVAPDVYPHGARIEKTFRLTGERAGLAEYRVSLSKADAQRLQEEAEGKIFAASAPQEMPQSFVILSSLPAVPGEENGTKFCWNAPAAAPPSSQPAAEHCEVFVAGGPAIPLPAAVTKMEFRNPHRPAFVLDWSGAGADARLVLEPKRYSVLLRLSCGTIEPGGAPGDYRIEFRVTETQ